MFISTLILNASGFELCSWSFRLHVWPEHGHSARNPPIRTGFQHTRHMSDPITLLQPHPRRLSNLEPNSERLNNGTILKNERYPETKVLGLFLPTSYTTVRSIADTFYCGKETS